MRILDPDLREIIAAEHVLGVHTPRVRARFSRLLKEDAAMRDLVERWEARLNLLALALPEEPPPARVWRAIQRRIARNNGRRTQVALSFWRYAALFTTAAAMALLVYIGIAPRTEAPYMVAVMSTPEAEPMLIAAWQDPDKRVLQIQVLSHREMSPDTAWELWSLPGKDTPPISMGLITAEAQQVMELDEADVRALANAEALAMSVEPKGGSPTGLPTGPVLASGPLRKI
jgi:anti-sigma-K factor RskA